MQESTTVRSVERAFQILKTVAANVDGVGVTNIANETGLPTSTVSRLLITLDRVDAVRRDESDVFSIGSAISELLANVPYSEHLMTIMRPFLQELAMVSGETVNLGLLDGDHIHFVDQVNSKYHLQMRDWIGYRFPLHVVAGGKLFLAYGPPELLENYVAQPLQLFTAASVVDPDELRISLTGIREQGYAWVHGEFEDEVDGIAAPVWGEGEQPIATVTLCGPAFRFAANGSADEAARLVVETANRISHRINRQLPNK